MNELAGELTPLKRRGEWAELKFMATATEHGLCVSKPWGETSHYDFVVEGAGGGLLRVQVKSTRKMSNGGYIVTNRGWQGSTYPENAYDFLAAYLVPCDVWFILPKQALQGKTAVTVQPTREQSKYGKYKEAWHLLGGKLGKEDPGEEGTEEATKEPGEEVAELTWSI